MPTTTEIRHAEEVLRAARTTVAELHPGDMVVLHRPPPGEWLCTESYVAVVDSSTNTTPTQIHPNPYYAVVVFDLATGDRITFGCASLFSVLRSDTEALVGAATLHVQQYRWARRILDGPNADTDTAAVCIARGYLAAVAAL